MCYSVTWSLIEDMQLDRTLLTRCLEAVLEPLVRFAIRHSVRLHDLIEILKRLLVRCATEELSARGERCNTTRVSLMTGVHRKDVERVQLNLPPPPSNTDLTMRVIGHWQTNRRFTTADGSPRVLTYHEDDSEFAALVSAISREITPPTVLRELERVGAVERSPRGLRLRHASYVPTGDVESGFKVIGHDINDLLRAGGTENTLEDTYPPHLHARTEYNNIYPPALPEIKEWFLREGHHFHRKAREFLSRFDLDVVPRPQFKGRGTRAVVTAFSYIEKPEDTRDS